MQRVMVSISTLLNPVMSALEAMNFHIRRELGELHFSFDWQSGIVTAIWVVLGFMLLRTLEGWLRVVAFIFVGLVLAKLYNVLPVA